MNRKGFTLIELLAVIVILAIIALIATPVILNIINSARANAKQRSAELVYTGVQYAYVSAMYGGIEGTYVANPSLKDIKQYLNVDNVDKENKVTFDNDDAPEMLKIETNDGAYCEVTIENGLQVSCYSSTEKENAKHYFTKYVQTDSESGEGNEPIVQESPKDWFIYDEATGTITGFSDTWNSLEDENKYDIVIPSTTPNGNTIVDIRAGAFSSRPLTSVTIPDSVITIGDGAFYQNNLTSLVLGDNVKTIGGSAFLGNKLESLDLGEGVQTIKSGAFYGNKLESVKIPDSMITIEAGAFNQNNITSLDLGNGTPTIAAAFHNNKLEYIKIPSGVTLLGGAFAYNNLITIELEPNVQAIANGAFYKGITSNDDISNLNLAQIINRTGKSFDWDNVINSSTSGRYTFETGIVENNYGNVTVTNTN